MVYCKGWEENSFLLARVEACEIPAIYCTPFFTFRQFIRKSGEVVMLNGKSVCPLFCSWTLGIKNMILTLSLPPSFLQTESD